MLASPESCVSVRDGEPSDTTIVRTSTPSDRGTAWMADSTSISAASRASSGVIGLTAGYPPKAYDTSLTGAYTLTASTVAPVRAAYFIAQVRAARDSGELSTPTTMR